MSKILDSILTLKSDMAASWMREFDRINIWEDVRVLYDMGWENEFTNRIVAYIVLAYDNESGWVEIHKDRMENKQKIMQRLGGNLKDPIIRSIIADELGEVAEVIGWFVAYQQDWRWETIIACFQYHSNMMRFSNSVAAVPEDEDDEDDYDVPEDDIALWKDSFRQKAGAKKKKKPSYLSEDKVAAVNLKKGDTIQKAIERRREGEAMWQEIQKEFVQLDTLLAKEGRSKATDAVDILSHEKFIAKRNANRNK